ncbi:MAG TPA: hypothetical protein VGM92_13500, partial [Candidatus Kapabacteria bacterium]
ALSSFRDATSEAGWMAEEEIRVKVPDLHSEFSIRTSRFQTASLKSSLWIYERETPGTAAIQQLAGLGWHVALRAEVQATPALTCSGNFAGTIYDSMHRFGSGVSAYNGTTDFIATVQLDVIL